MAATAHRVSDDTSTWTASCAEHPKFRAVRGSMRLAISQAEGHNRVMHPNADRDAPLREALRARKEACDAGAE